MASTSRTISFNLVLSSWLPIFNGESYQIWSIKMKTISIPLGLWNIVENGCEVPPIELKKMKSGMITRQNNIKKTKKWFVVVFR